MNNLDLKYINQCSRLFYLWWLSYNDNHYNFLLFFPFELQQNFYCYNWAMTYSLLSSPFWRNFTKTTRADLPTDAGVLTWMGLKFTPLFAMQAIPSYRRLLAICIHRNYLSTCWYKLLCMWLVKVYTLNTHVGTTI